MKILLTMTMISKILCNISLQTLNKHAPLKIKVMFCAVSIKSIVFPKNLKLADIAPLHKKCKKYIKCNYRPINILPNFSKIFEKCIFTQMSLFFGNVFLK